ncbi:MAG: hypothetical protein AAGG44_16180 [Planctomycetota bacterium]
MIKSCFLLPLSILFTTGMVYAQSSEPHPQETAVVQLVQAADRAIADKDFAKAIGSLKQAVKIFPDDMDLQFKLASTLLEADRMPEMWSVLRNAARKQPEHPDIARGLLSYWRMYDQQGLFNCGKETIETIIKVLGRPDQIVNGPDRDRYLWGFLAVEVKHGQKTVYQCLDMRGLTSEILEPLEFVDLGSDGKRVPGHRTINKSTSMVEFVLPGESVQNWTQLLSVQRMHGLAKQKASVRQIAEGMMDSLAETNPQRKYRILDESEDGQSVTFEWTAPASGKYQAQHEIVRMMRGAIDIHRIALVVRGTEQMDPTLRSNWLSLFSNASLKSTGTAERPAANLGDYETAWLLGHHLSIAVLAHAQRNESIAKPNLLKSLQLVKRLKANLPKPFERTADDSENVARAVRYLYEDTLAELYRQQLPVEQIATFEVSARINTLFMLGASRELTEKSMVMIKKAAKRSPLPGSVFAPLDEVVSNGSSPEVIRATITGIQRDVKSRLSSSQPNEVAVPQEPNVRHASSDKGSQVLYLNGAKAGEITSSGEVWIAGDKVGDITSDGEIWVRGVKEGDVTSEGEVWKSGNKVGDITQTGEIWREGNRLGSIEKNGDIWIDGTQVGSIEGGSARNAAAVLFFGFYQLKN